MSYDKPAVKVVVTLPATGKHEDAVEAIGKAVADVRNRQEYTTEGGYGSGKRTAYHFTLDVEYRTDRPTLADLGDVLERFNPRTPEEG